MRRLIAMILALSVAFASMAWAVDLHPEALTGEHVSLDQGQDDVSDAAPCDHCCHGDAHHTALCDSDAPASRVPRDVLRPSLVMRSASRPQMPPTPPPDI